MGNTHDKRFGKFSSCFRHVFNMLDIVMRDLKAMETLGRVSTGVRYSWISTSGYANDSLYFPSLTINTVRSVNIAGII